MRAPLNGGLRHGPPRDTDGPASGQGREPQFMINIGRAQYTHLDALVLIWDAPPCDVYRTDPPRERDSLRPCPPEDKGPYALTPNTVELIPTLGALFPRGGPVQDPVLTESLVMQKGCTAKHLSKVNSGAKLNTLSCLRYCKAFLVCMCRARI